MLLFFFFFGKDSTFYKQKDEVTPHLIYKRVKDLKSANFDKSIEFTPAAI